MSVKEWLGATLVIASRNSAQSASPPRVAPTLKRVFCLGGEEEYFSRFTILEDSGAAAGSSRVSGERAEAARRKGLVRAARDLSPLFWTHHAPGARSAAGDLPAAMTCRRLCSFCSLTSALSFSRSLFCRSSTSCDAAEVLPPLPMVRVPPTHTYRDPSGTGEQSRAAPHRVPVQRA